MSFSELNCVELQVVEWLVELGWTFRTPKEMRGYARPLADPFVEPILVDALLRLNLGVIETSEDALAVIDQILRPFHHTPDWLLANSNFLALLQDGARLQLRPGAPTQTVRLVDFEDIGNNDLCVARQYQVRGTKTIRADLTLLVNGIPLVLIEAKSPTAHDDWLEAVKQFVRYQEEAPQLLASNLLNVAADGLKFRYGATNAPPEYWAEWKDAWPRSLPPKACEMQVGVTGLLSPDNLLDMLAHFWVFETRDNRTVKKVARYQQFRAANKIVDRVTGGEHDRGLVWHTQGSGKSLTMIFTAQKLRRHPSLQQPTVFIIVDRVDLDTQITGTFEAVDFPNVDRAFSIADLWQIIESGKRGVFVTTIQKFQELGDVATDRSNIIVLADESHRSQEGLCGLECQRVMPRAKRFGFTGTPIDRDHLNTFRNFGPIVEGKQERYLDIYSIRQAIADKATVPVYYQPRDARWRIERELLDAAFEETFEHFSEAERTRLQKENARLKLLMKSPERVASIAEDIAQHFREHVEPNGFKGQIVCVDREACALVKKELDKHLPPEASTVVISEGQNDEALLREHHRGKAGQEAVIREFKKPGEMPQLLIVCDMLLTGFDAPIEQVMYLDKPLRDHSLLQAIARTNRPHEGKKNGVVVDYFGVFQNLQVALNYDEAEIEDAVFDWDALKEQFPVALAEALSYFAGIELEDSVQCLLACLRRLESPPERQAEFERRFRQTQALWEAIMPDPDLYAYRHSYAWLCDFYMAYVKRFKREDTTNLAAYGAKTRELILEHTHILDVQRDLPLYRIDENYLVLIHDLEGDPDDKAAEMEQAVAREIQIRRGTDPAYERLSERLERILKAKREGMLHGIQLMLEYRNLIQDVVETIAAPEREGVSPGELAIMRQALELAPDADPERCKSLAQDIASFVQANAFAGWTDSTAACQRVGQEIARLLLHDYRELNLFPGGFKNAAVDYAVQHYADVS
ncbi:type I restriction endonuclease subunit R [bacterium]|nr:type I restriction endonuclease subunit R [bacterium]